MSLTQAHDLHADSTLTSETITFCSELIRFDTSNFGAGDSRGERAAATYVAEKLAEVGYEPTILESAPGRANTVVRIPGVDREAPALLVHGHLDVVPAAASDWSFDPFCGDVRDGAVWGRGALDMKDMDAMMLACARGLARDGVRPPRDIVMAFVADEEDTGEYGANYLVAEHPGLFEGVTTAIGESGGYTVHLPDGSRLYPIATGERGSAWMTLTARGPAGHGSRPHDGNAVAVLAAAVARLAAHRWPVRLGDGHDTVSLLIEGLASHLGVSIDVTDPASLAQLGEARPLVESSLRNTVSPTMLRAGYKHNVIPSEASAGIDGRILPGRVEEFLDTVDELLGPHVSREFASFAAPVSAPADTPAYAAMAAALKQHDPDALILPFWMAGGTDAKAFSRLGIACYGFAPGRTPLGFPAESYVHGVDERVLTDSLSFGVHVLDDFLRAAPTPSPR